MITKNSVVKIQILIVNHKSEPVKLKPVIIDIFLYHMMKTVFLKFNSVTVFYEKAKTKSP